MDKMLQARFGVACALVGLGALGGCAALGDGALEDETEGEEPAGGDEDLGTSEDEVINGYDATGHWDGVVRLATWELVDGGVALAAVTRCSAVMLTNQWAATLASCLGPLERSDPSRLRMMSPDGGSFLVREVVIHPDPGRNLALVRLTSPMIIYGSTSGIARQQSGRPLAWLSGRDVRCYGYGPTQAGGSNSGVATWALLNVGAVNGADFRVDMRLDSWTFMTGMADRGGGCLAPEWDGTQWVDTLMGIQDEVTGNPHQSWNRGLTTVRGWIGQAQTTHELRSPTGTCIQPAAGTTFQTGPCTGADPQAFRLVDMGGEFVQLRLKSTGACLEMPEGAGTAAPPRAATCASDFGLPHQQWRFEDRRLESVRIVNRATGQCLGRTSAAALEQRPCDYTEAQIWSLPARTEHGATRHGLQNVGNGKCVDAPNANPTTADQWTCFGVPQEEFRVVQTSAPLALHELRFGHSNNCLMVAGALGDSGAVVDQGVCTGGAHQQWRLLRRQRGYQVRVAHSNQCLTANANGADGQVLQQTECTFDEPRQLWRWQ
jgi:hypothetical protein